MLRINSCALSGPPNPASASATIGASQWRCVVPSDDSIWSARISAALIRRSTAGTLSTG
jgi:hypothetical protein